MSCTRYGGGRLVQDKPPPGSCSVPSVADTLAAVVLVDKDLVETVDTNLGGKAV